MKWFEGDIPTAIQNAKTRKVVFVVYIMASDQDEMSNKMNVTWEDSAVTAACEQSGLVALKMNANSETCVQFSQIYPVVVVPCTYFIGNNGVPLEVNGGFVEPADFADKIKTVDQNHKAQIEEVVPAAAAAPVAPTPVAPAVIQPEPSTSAAMSSPPVSQQEPEEPAGDKVEKAKLLITQKREEKMRKEEQENKDKEKERREMARDVGKLKAWKDDVKRKEDVNEWKKDREEAKIAREKVKEQIARDRLERSAKFQKEKDERAQVQEQKKEAKSAADSEAAVQQAAERKLKTRLQFRLPDGSSITQEFQSRETLQTAFDFLRHKTGNSYGNFTLQTTFPKRQFTEAEMSQTLLALDLAPSAALIVLPHSRVVPTSGGGGGGGGSLIWSLLAPLLALWNFIYTFLFGAPQQPRGLPNPGTPQPGPSQSQSQQQSVDSDPHTSEQDPQQQQKKPRSTRPKSSYGVRSRKEGNIHRFSADDDDDEDMTTWNGNSTQQL